mmetsp:Transcript_72169/g.222955  ORF Transcript_72169/g.222955 Transcript_72169/m.222955 type:complete len:213 (+) Transcript_72169:53-691(+)
MGSESRNWRWRAAHPLSREANGSRHLHRRQRLVVLWWVPCSLHWIPASSSSAHGCAAWGSTVRRTASQASRAVAGRRAGRDGARADLYRVLELDVGASEGEVRRAYRRLVLRYHPDVDRSEGAGQRFQKILDAYRSLVSSPALGARRAQRTRQPKAATPASAWRRRPSAQAPQARGLDFLDRMLPPKEVVAYFMVFLVVAPYLANVFYALWW